MDDRIPLDGVTLVTGPSNAGKTRRTARALDRWVDERGTDGVVVLDFAPEVVREGTLLGGRLDRFTRVPDGVWTGVLDAHAPRASAGDRRGALRLAASNARRARRLLDAMPADPRAVFVNDATIPCQADAGDATALADRWEAADCVVCNAFESDELGADDRVSRNERAALDALRSRADRVVDL
ncbi:hypothetical protein [Candidatus Halobonum tyrrellensis]|uniref:Uncharacterized protein n=1 Tax=Candidatus Halobonum tyrrellensis G22 TaxID=1324957 RepID=V4GXP6_9EURY|nr:hypothetical protein [Candidatus Halobonum tyrrellensis]ESP89931.1 hypothetical protein K933_00172 [Candidatus Halobonum tyrrellensis G22]